MDADDIEFGSTAYSDAAFCLARYNYRHNEHLILKPNEVKGSMRRGTWIHRALELIDRGKPWLPELDIMAQWALGMGVDENAVNVTYDQTRSIVFDYQAYWSGHDDELGPWTTVATEIPLVYEPAKGRRIKPTLDCIKRDKRGRLWIWERKSTSDIPDSNWRNVDPQTMLQYIAARNTGEYGSLAGIVFDYVLTDAGPKMQVKKDGRFYATLADAQTTSRAFAAAEKEVRANWKVIDSKKQPIDEWASPDDYLNAMRTRMVNDGKWFQRYNTFRPEDNARVTLKDVAFTMHTVATARRMNHWPRAFNITTCRRFCPYGHVCIAEYISGRRAEVIRQEFYNIETPELRAEGRTDA